MDLQNKENLAQHISNQYYSSSKTVSYNCSYSSTKISTDSVDACLENGHRNGTPTKCITYSSKNLSMTTNGQSKSYSHSSVQEYSNGDECKSFIQQRVERLYGPGALAQGFFVTKRQKSRISESESEKNSNSMKMDKHSKSMNDKSLDEDNASNLKQSTSSPALPVLRHLRPEFRAQLPIMSPKKGSESPMQKSTTVPTLKSDRSLNGHAMSTPKEKVQINGGFGKKDDKVVKSLAMEPTSSEEVKDGHYFIKILETEAKRLLELADEVEEELQQSHLPEEALGYLRSASGKARLLVSQKMQQFKGLCTNNITQVEGEAFPTTNEDLQGFWDMVMLQVDQIDALFKELNTLRANNWQEVKPDTTDNKSATNGTKVKKLPPRSRPTNTAAEEARKQREAQRKAMIEAKRRAMREAKQQPKQNIEIYVPESS